MFESIINFFYIILYQPLFNALVLLYDYVPGHDFGVAIIFLTLIIRFILYPISVKAVSSQKGLQKLQPKILEVQKKYKDEKEKQAKEILELYKTEKINPFSGLLLAIIQIPILIALYRVFLERAKPKRAYCALRVCAKSRAHKRAVYAFDRLVKTEFNFCGFGGLGAVFPDKNVDAKNRSPKN